MFGIGFVDDKSSELRKIYSNYVAGSKGQKESFPSLVNEGSDDDSPAHKIAPIINKLNENRSKLMSMFSELDKYKCSKVKHAFIYHQNSS